MSASLEVSALEKDIEAGNFDITGRIANIRNLVLFDDVDQFLPNEAKTIALHIWNCTIMIQRFLGNANALDVPALKDVLIPSMRILSVEIYQKFIDISNESDGVKLFYMLSFTYKSLLDSNNIESALQYLQSALNLYNHVNNSTHLASILVQLTIWRAQYEISHNRNFDKALENLMEFVATYKTESVFLISFIYEKSVESQSIEWAKYCLSLINGCSTISFEWKIQIESLLAQFYINNNKPDESMKYINNLPDSLNKLYLKLKCSILLSPNEENLKERLISFVPISNENHNLLIDLCIFIANRCNIIGQVSIDFIKEVMNSSQQITNENLRKPVYFCAIKISSELDDIETASSFISIINSELNENDKKEISTILWNKALDMFDANEYEISAQWMQLSRNQINDFDNEGHSSCFRFICRCYFEAGKYEEALPYANDAIQCHPSCFHGYLLKFRILIKMGNKNASYDFVDEIINNSPYIGQFEPFFFSTIAAELHSIGNNNLALKTLIKSYELNFNADKKEITNNESSISTTIFINTKKNIIKSIFALLQKIDDIAFISKTINILSSKWSSQVIYKIIDKEDENRDDSDNFCLSFTENEINSFVSVAFKNGLDLKNKNKWKKAISSFMSGSLFSGDLIDCKAPCIFEAIDCYIKLIIPNDDAKLSFFSSDSPLSLAQSAIDEISPIIENSSNIKQSYKDGLLLVKLKVSIVIMNIKPTKESNDQVIQLIKSIRSAEILFDLTIFVCDYKVSQEIVFAILETAIQIDNELLSLSASLLHQLIVQSKTLEESRKSYEIILDFLGKNNSSLSMSNSQLQFFMSHAWNIGVRCAKSLRSKDSEWFFKAALSILEMNDDLKSQYYDELNEKYLQFLVHNKNRIAFSF